jgi:hypothetical protein
MCGTAFIICESLSDSEVSYAWLLSDSDSDDDFFREEQEEQEAQEGVPHAKEAPYIYD